MTESLSSTLLVVPDERLEPNLLTGRFELRPRLPPTIQDLTLTDIPFGHDRVTVAVGTDGAKVTGLNSNVALQIDNLRARHPAA